MSGFVSSTDLYKVCSGHSDEGGARVKNRSACRLGIDRGTLYYYVLDLNLPMLSACKFVPMHAITLVFRPLHKHGLIIVAKGNEGTIVL